MSSQPDKARSFLGSPRAAAIVISLALLTRLAYLLTCGDDPSAFQPVVDAQTYHQLAVDVVQTRQVTEKLLWQASFYPLFLAAIYKVLGVSLWAVKIIQAVIGASACWLTIKLGQEAFDRRTGLLAGLVVALSGPLIFFDSQLLATNLAVLWFVLIAWLALRQERNPHPGRFFLLGLVLALATLTRPTFLVLLPVLVLRWAWAFRQQGPLRMLANLSLATAGLALVLAPYGAWMKSQTDHWGILPPSGGINLFIGNNADFDRTITLRPGLGWDELVAEPYSHGFAPNPWAGQPYYTGRVREFAAGQPVGFAALLGRKTLHLLSTRELPRNVDIYLHRSWSPVLRPLVWRAGGWGFPLGIILPLAAVGLVLAGRKVPPVLLLLGAVYAASLVVVFVSARYRAPLIPLVAVLAAFGLGQGIQAIREGRIARLVPALGVALMVLALGTLPGPFAQEKSNFPAELHFGVGWNYYQQENWPAAEEHLRQAVQLDPRLTSAHNFLGIALARQQKFDQADVQFAAALDLDPGYTEAANNRQRNRQLQAEHLYRQGRTLEPDDSAAAMALYRQVFRLNPQWPEVIVRLAWISSTARIDSLRDGTHALELLTLPAVRKLGPDPYVLYVRAAALAESDRRDEALETARQARDQAQATGRADLLDRINAAITALDQRRPLRF
jgi:4-amino-4-deoxy-L-arabinose transferase-like glycosyltransferase